MGGDDHDGFEWCFDVAGVAEVVDGGSRLRRDVGGWHVVVDAAGIGFEPTK